MEVSRTARITVAWLAALLFAVVLFNVLSPFFRAAIWSFVAVFVTWPFYEKLKKYTGFSASLSSLLMTSLMVVVVFVAVVPISLELINEGSKIFQFYTFSFVEVVERVNEIPHVGPWLSANLKEWKTSAQAGVNPATMLFGPIINMAQGFIGSLATLACSLFISFFLYRDGALLRAQFKAVASYLGGKEVEALLEQGGRAIVGTVYGAIFTSLAQGVLAGIGFYFAGIETPVVSAFAVSVFSFIPFGAPIIYVPICVYLGFLAGEWGAAIGLTIWCVAVVSTADNFLRTFFIAQSTDTSVLLVFMGVVGGVVAFGMLGLVVGPVTIIIAQSLWSTLLGAAQRTTDNSPAAM